MKTLKQILLWVLLIFSIFFGFASYYLGQVDLAPLGLVPDQKISAALNDDKSILAMATEGNVKKITSKCGIQSQTLHLAIELKGSPTVIKERDEPICCQRGSCIDNYYVATFEGNKVTWAGWPRNYPKEYIYMADDVISIKSTIKGELEQAQFYARNKASFGEGWKVKE